ncbi:MAG: hypothetical protein WCT04_25110 [Planctomycetota bacterium]
MIKLSANISKKVPIPGCEYSSQQFGASMEIEVSDADKSDEIQTRITELYGLLSSSIDAQIAGAAQQPANGLQSPAANVVPIRSQPTPSPVQQQQPAAPQRNGYAVGRNRVAAVNGNGNGTTNGNGRRVNCTEAQAKCIYAICKAQGLDMLSVLADYSVADARDLHVKDASRLIDQLKSQNGNGTAAH